MSEDARTSNLQPDGPGTEERRRERRARRALVRNAKRAALVLAAIVSVGALIYAFLPEPVPVDMAAAARGPMQVTVDEDAVTRVVDRFVVSAPITGSMPRIALDPGDAVAAGNTLTRIVPTRPPLLDARSRAEAEARLGAAQARERQARAELSRAVALYEQAETEAERLRKLGARGAVSRQEVDRAMFEKRARAKELESARFGVKVATQEVAVARAVLGRFDQSGDAEKYGGIDVISPVNGQVLKVYQESEAVVSAGAPLLEIGNPSSLEVVADILTRDAVHIEPGSKVMIHRWGGDEPLAGHVHRIEPSAFTEISALGVEEQRVNVIVDFDDPREKWKSLGDGYRVEVSIVIWQTDDALTVPASAVFRYGDGWAVYAVQDGKAVRRAVEVGRRNDEQAQITGGLEEGDRVILFPSDRISDGVKVTARKQ